MSAARFGLSEKTVEKIDGVLAGHPEVERAVLYGSRAMGNYKNGSDIDLTLIGSGLGYLDLLKIMGELDDLLLPYIIDLSICHMLGHKELRENIQRVGQDFYRRQGVGQPLPVQSA